MDAPRLTKAHEEHINNEAERVGRGPGDEITLVPWIVFLRLRPWRSWQVSTPESSTSVAPLHWPAARLTEGQGLRSRKVPFTAVHHVPTACLEHRLSLIHISEPTRPY